MEFAMRSVAELKLAGVYHLGGVRQMRDILSHNRRRQLNGFMAAVNKLEI
jgi:hypothetical protein